MHDIILAKQILEEIQKVAKERGIGKIKSVSLEIGSLTLAHDGFPEHTDDIDFGNIKFLLETMSQNNGLNKVHPVRNSAGKSGSANVMSNRESIAGKKHSIFSNGVKFDIKKIPGNSWKILEIEE